MITYQWIHNNISPRFSGYWEFASSLKNLYQKRPQDAEPTFGGTDHILFSF